MQIKSDFQIKHLEIIQTVINRLAGNSFLIKGWAITISLAGFGLFTNKNNSIFLILVLFSAVIFWILDSYYLRQEKLFRNLYQSLVEQARNNGSELGSFTMNVSGSRKNVQGLLCIMFSFPVVLIYLAIIGMAGLLFFRLKFI